jgi:uncharacterized protein (DUF1330 family)
MRCGAAFPGSKFWRPYLSQAKLAADPAVQRHLNSPQGGRFGWEIIGRGKEEMAVLIVAQLRFKDRERYDRYQARFADVFRKFRGRVIAAAEHPRVLEGESGPDKIVVLEFPDDAAALEFHDAAEYQEIAIDRKAGADALVLQFKSFA